MLRDCRTIVDAVIGPAAYLEGVNRLENVTIRSDAEESTWIGEGVDLMDGVVGFGCRVGYGAKAIRFVLGARARWAWRAHRNGATAARSRRTVRAARSRGVDGTTGRTRATPPARAPTDPG